ncbi:MAG: hypothetical protein UH851_01145 [Clostridia bacterium]|nr:hypothetical protein [Clostridia bacterium]
MKRIICMICTLLIISCLICSCGGNEDGGNEYKLVYKNTTLKVGDAFKVDKIGTPNKVMEKEGCAGVGAEREYIFDGISIYTYETKNGEIITWISLTDDSISTPENIKVGDSKDDMESAYGEALSYDNESVAVCRSGNTKLAFELRDGYIVKIQYSAVK